MSVPANVNVFDKVNVLDVVPPAIVNPAAEDVRVNPFIDVAVATPIFGVTSVGELPKDVNDELVTDVPKAVAESTDTLLILNTLPVARLKFSEDVQLAFVRSHVTVLLVVPYNRTPPPLAVVSAGVATLPISIFLS